MSRNLLTMLDYEAQRRPELADLIVRIDLLSEDDIKIAPVKLPWMRQALLALKHEHDQNQLAACMDQWVVHGQTPDPEGEMRRWEAADAFVKVGRTALEVCYGQLVWFGPGGVWIDTIRAAEVDPLLVRNTRSCGRIAKSGYMAAVRQRARDLCPSASTLPSMERVRFFRPG